MLLCIDIGNTNIFLGVYDKSDLLAEFRLESNLNQTADEYVLKLMDIFNFYKLDTKKISGVIIASVVPSLDSIFEKAIKKFFGITPFVGPGVKVEFILKLIIPNNWELIS